MGCLMPEGVCKTATSERRKEREVANCRLIRASLSAVVQEDPRSGIWRKEPPPELTHAENYYYVKQMEARTPMVVVLNSEEVLHGVIEWYDMQCVTVNCVGKPNLLIMKSAIRYPCKQQSGAPRNAEPVVR